MKHLKKGAAALRLELAVDGTSLHKERMGLCLWCDCSTTHNLNQKRIYCQLLNLRNEWTHSLLLILGCKSTTSERMSFIFHASQPVVPCSSIIIAANNTRTYYSVARSQGLINNGRVCRTCFLYLLILERADDRWHRGRTDHRLNDPRK